MAKLRAVGAVASCIMAIGCGASGSGATAGDDAADAASALDSAQASDAVELDSASDAVTIADGGDAASEVGDDSAIAGWTLAWRDEFDGPDGSPVDPSKWVHEVGGDGWGNSEREYYTDGTKNAVQRGGNLEITIAKADGSLSCWYGTCLYTSARLITKGHYSTQYGRIASRIQIPRGQGVWPAFWMLGTDIDKVGWPACGEIDIMENIGREPNIDHGSLHQTGWNATGQTTATAPLGDGFHVYAVEWDATGIRFFLDDVLYETKKPSDVPTGSKWVFDSPFFLLLNVAVGGSWPGDPDSTTVFPQKMLVDWVRVYTKP